MNRFVLEDYDQILTEMDHGLKQMIKLHPTVPVAEIAFCCFCTLAIRFQSMCVF